MIASNHAITGAAIAISLSNPIAMPLAFFSHFVLDAIPHFGVPIEERSSKLFLNVLVIDLIILTSLFLLFTLFYSVSLWLVIISMILAIIPDAVWAVRWYKEVKYGADPNKFNDPLTKIHSKIQWYEKPSGLIVEITWFISIALIIIYIL